MFYSRNFGGKASKVQVYLNMYTDVEQFFYLVLKVSCHRVTTIWSKKKKKKNRYKPYVPARVALHRHVSTIQ